MGLSSQLAPSSLARPGVCTSSTRPASPYEGQVIYETDTDRTLVWNGSAWVFLSTSTANPVGVEFVKTQTVGSAVSSVTVSDAFSSTYDNYRVTYVGGTASTNSPDLRLALGSANTGYYGNLFFQRPNATTPSGVGNDNIAYWQYGAGIGTTNHIAAAFDLYGPNLARYTAIRTDVFEMIASSSAVGIYTGFQASTTQFTAFTITASTGTLTGGTIRVYGYKN